MKFKLLSAKSAKIVTVATRLVVICLLIAAFLILGEKYGPHQNNRAEATVYERFFRAASSIPAYESVHSQSTAPRETFLNGNRMLHTVTTTTDSIEKVLDYYTELYSTGQVKILTEEQEKTVREALEKTDDPKLRQILEDLPKLEELFSSPRPMVIELTLLRFTSPAKACRSIIHSFHSVTCVTAGSG